MQHVDALSHPHSERCTATGSTKRYSYGPFTLSKSERETDIAPEKIPKRVNVVFIFE